MGFLLDTNVISELVKVAPSQRVVEWLRGQDPAQTFISAITLGEIVRGVERLPAGRRRRDLARWVEQDLTIEFEGRILAYDQAAAVHWGRIMGAADRRGRPRAAAYALIASIARHHGLTLATRNTRDFAGTGARTFNPWSAG